jgi:transcriptional regulator with XRE-family HTH domain
MSTATNQPQNSALSSGCDVGISSDKVFLRLRAVCEELKADIQAVKLYLLELRNLLSPVPSCIDIDRLLQGGGCSPTQHVRISSEHFLSVDMVTGDDRKEVLRELGGLFRGIRKHKGLSLEEVSDQIGVDLSYLSRFETGQRKWSIALLKDLTQALDPSLNLDSILGLIGSSEAKYKRIKTKKAALNANPELEQAVFPPQLDSGFD